MKSETKKCQNCKKEFTIEPEDFAFLKRINIPPPTFCWRCRAIRRMAFRNIRHPYFRTCDATKQKIFTLMPPDNPMPVYEDRYWASDNWDPLEYGMDYDFSKPFFVQIKELYNKVPWGVMWSMQRVNSDYAVGAYSKNCYLNFDSGFDEDSAYSVTLLYSKQCLDMVNSKDCELCYYCINTNQSYKTFFSRNCTSCVEVWFSQDCISCNNCLGCSGLRNKSYCIFNQQYSKEEYKTKLEAMKLDSWSSIRNIRKQAEKFWEQSPVKFQHSVRVMKGRGDYLYNGKELYNCFFVGNAQNMRHCISVIYPSNKDGMDVTSSENTDLAYETLCSGEAIYKTLAVVECINTSESAYSINCRFAENVFGCVALHSKSYCILNKQYSKEEYFKMLPKIIKHMNDMPYTDAQGRVYKYGEFFPFDMSSFGYNQSQAFEYFPISREEAEKMGYRWKMPEERKYDITMHTEEIPDSIADVTDKILEEVIQCEHNKSKNHSFGCDADCATAFRITKQELDFYRRLGLPLPRLCFNCRHIDRIKWRNVPALYQRQCMCDKTNHPHHLDIRCPSKFETSYPPENPQIIYCEDCYNKEVY